MRRLIFLLVLWTAVGLAQAGDLDRATGGQDVTVSIASPFSVLPPGHIVPYRVTIRNDRNGTGTWQIHFMGTTSASTAGATYLDHDMTVAANTTGVFDLLVPLPTLATGEYGGTNLSAAITGPGFTSGPNDFFARFYSGSTYYPSASKCVRSPYTLIGNGVLGDVGLGPLETSYKDRSEQFFGSAVDVAELPSDWRAYSGVASFLLKDSEWLSLNAAQRAAVCDYVAMGGHLTLLTSDTAEVKTPQLQLPEPDGKPGPYGFGNITLQSGLTFPPDRYTLTKYLQDSPVELAQNIDLDFSTWPLRKLVGTIAVSSVFILSFVVFFGSLIGPVNLFVFAPGKKRFRLFWTTPLISIIASVALIVSILLTDGLGGTGRQMIVIFSLPGANREAVIQEQVSRTAVLFRTEWQNQQDYLISAVSTRSMDNASGGAGSRANNYQQEMADASNTYRQSGNEFSGDWFRSRSASGQYLQAVRNSRAALTVLNPQGFASGQPPQVLSSFAGTLDVVYLLDGGGHYWTCRQLAPGSKQTCTSATYHQFRRFWNDARANAGGMLKRVLNPDTRTGYFYATGTVPPSERLTTLGEIQWQLDKGIYLGPWVASTAPEGTP